MGVMPPGQIMLFGTALFSGNKLVTGAAG